MKIGLALGSGASRGWSHIGVINALSEQGIEPDIVCGCSIGALVGGAYAANRMDALEDWVRSLTKLEVARFFELNTSLNGFVNTERLHQFLNRYVAEDDFCIESAAKVFAAVSTDLKTGREVWFTEGPLIEAVWASISLPGLFPAIRNKNRWLIDGGLVNPVPISMCRALGADIVIAVNLSDGMVRRRFDKPKKEAIQKQDVSEPEEGGIVRLLRKKVKEYSNAWFSNDKSENPPGLFDAIAGSINITQDRITRSRMAGDPPDVVLTPRLAHIGLLEFYRADEAIAEGRACVERMLAELRQVIEWE